jgi:CIC family chloride channel protein
MLATTVSTITARSIMGESIYSMKLIRKGLRLLGGREETVMTTFRVRDIMHHHVPTVSTDTPLADIVTMFFDSPITELYVVDGERRLRGVVSLHDIKEMLTESSLEGIVVAHDLMVSIPTVLPDDRLADCMRTFAGAARAELPVVSGRGGAPIGMITQRDLLDLYDREVLRREMLGTAEKETDRANALPAGHRLRSIQIPASWVGKTLHEIDLRRRSGMTVISIKSAYEHLGAKAPDPERPLLVGDVLVVLGSIEASQALDRLLEESGVTVPAGSMAR